MQNILLLEDNQALSKTICYSLSSPTTKIYRASSLSDAYKLLHNFKFDLAIIDRLVDDGDGLELVEYITQELNDLYVLVISHKSSIAQKLEGLRSGALDYLSKPLHLEELRLKSQQFLQITNDKHSQILQIGQIQLDQHSGLLTVDQYQIQLRKRETELLACLIRRKNYVVTRNQMISLVWGLIENPPFYSTLDVYMRRIRLKLGPAASYLKTVRGFGYKLCQPHAELNHPL